jgi:VWFA-related protein
MEKTMSPLISLTLSVFLLFPLWPYQQPDSSGQTPVRRGKNDSAKREHNGHGHPSGANPTTPPLIKPKLEPLTPDASTPVALPAGEVDKVKLAVDLVVLDAQVVQQKTGRIVGALKKDDFSLFEDGVHQQISHFSQDTLPLSVIILVDRGSCLDPFGEKVRQATVESLERLKPQDEVAVMAFHNNVEVVSGFSHDKNQIRAAMDNMLPHDEDANHCFNRAFYEAARFMRRASNPDGRRVIIVITAVTTSFDCEGPTGEQARLAVLESGSVVCGIIPKSAGQKLESGAMRAITGIGGLFKVRSSHLKKLAEETGGEIMTDKPERLDQTFNTLISHLRTRYSIGFVSTNSKRDGSFRKIKLELNDAIKSGPSKFVVKTRRGYISARESSVVDKK